MNSMRYWIKRPNAVRAESMTGKHPHLQEVKPQLLQKMILLACLKSAKSITKINLLKSRQSTHMKQRCVIICFSGTVQILK